MSAHTTGFTMNEEQALARMVPPGKKRPGIWRQGVLQIMVTRSCDKSCCHCTQASNLKGPVRHMSPELFSQAVASLYGYFGVVGVFGGNPAVSPYFAQYCEILKAQVPYEQRGLWCNNPLGKGPLMRGTFNPAVSNLNVHLDQKAHDEFARDWPESAHHLKGLEEDSRHGPPLVAMSDVEPNELKRWDMIASCDVNQRWSAIIGETSHGLRAYVCELMLMQANVHPEWPDLGLQVTAGWWRKPMQDFVEQVKHHCHACGMPLKGYGSLAVSGDVDQASKMHKDVVVPKRQKHGVQLVTLRSDLGDRVLPRATDYIENGSL